MPAPPPRRIVIGIGNPDRGDDGAGRAVARLLAGRLPADVELTEHGGETTGLLARLDGAAAAFLIDACASGAPAGTIHRFDAADRKLPHSAFAASSHGMGLAEAVELARALGQLPPRCIVYAIEGGSFASGAALTPAVAAASGDVADRLCAEITDNPPGKDRQDA